MVELLLDHGSEVYGGDFHLSFSPFYMLGHHTCPFARYMSHGKAHRTTLRETIRILRDRGLDINGLDSASQTPLFLAVKNMDLKPYILEQLIENGADINKGHTMASAICFGNIDAVSLLLNAGAGIHFTLTNGQEKDILSYAVCRGFEPSYVKKCLALCPQLRERDVLDDSDGGGWTALHHAAYCGDIEGVRALLDAGADTKKLSSVDETALELAALTLEEFNGDVQVQGGKRSQL
ncbi:hypothetical protein QQX98_002882 [Neonectria punicea]|uniref:Ankyrin n=1 Tax=Neonectria punicea TaxID=979145 RepID=A0ABR1HHA4_9HYPO